MDYKRLFLNWLKQHNIRQEFLFNCRTVRSAIGTRHCYPITYIWKEDPFLYIINSFSWEDSEEGYYFWDSFHFVWQDFLSHYNNTH